MRAPTATRWARAQSTMAGASTTASETAGETSVLAVVLPAFFVDGLGHAADQAVGHPVLAAVGGASAGFRWPESWPRSRSFRPPPRHATHKAARFSHIVQRLLEGLSSPVDPAHDGADGDIGDLGDLLVAESLHIGEEYRHA